MKKSHRTGSAQRRDRDGEPIPKPFSSMRRLAAGTRPNKQVVTLVTAFTDAAATGAPFAFAVDTSSVTGSTFWSDWAALYQEYRVISVRATLVPRWNETQSTGIQTAAWGGYPGAIVSAFYQQASFAGIAALSQAQGAQYDNGSKMKIMRQVSAQSFNPFALEWNPTTTAPAANQRFGVQFQGTAVANAAWNTLVTHDIFYEFEVEFRAQG